MSSSRVRNALLVSAAAVLTAGCSTDTTISSLDEVSHIHGIVVNEGTTYVGTHEGLFTPTDDGTWQRAGDEFDVMGLTAVNGTLLVSGHPAPGFEFPDPLGLLASNDGGASWTSRSLTGDVDFHLLRASGQTVIGVAANYGVVLKSEDGGVTWEEKTVPPFTDVALDPADPDYLALATETGLAMSSDGGESFSTQATETIAQRLYWSDSGLFGSTPTTVLVWDPGAADWRIVEEGFNNILGFAVTDTETVLLDGRSLVTLSGN